MSDIIRTSDRGIFKRCRQQWDFTSKIRQNLEPIQRYMPFDFGTAFHAGMQAYYEPETWGDYDLMKRNAMAAFRLSITELRGKAQLLDLELEDEYEEATKTGIAMLEYYFLWAPSRDKFKPVYVEIEFEVEIPGLPGVKYQGRIDLIIEDEFGYWIVDHKTAAQFASDMSWLYLDDQCSSYAWALQKMLGLEIRGVIYNEVRKSPPKPPNPLQRGGYSRNKQQDTTFEMYLATLRKAGIDPRLYRNFLLYLKQNPKEFVRRKRIEYAPEFLVIVEDRIRKEAIEMLRPDVAIYPTPSKFNCNGCRFFGPCLQTQEGRPPFLDLYERRS